MSFLYDTKKHLKDIASHVVQSATAPNVTEGAIYYNTTDQKTYRGVNGSWAEITAGAPGADGTNGTNGTNGVDGDTGASITSAAFVSNDLVFTKDDTNTVTLLNALIDLKGEQGIPGNDGADGIDGADGSNGITWRSGTGVPDNGVGVDGDFYLRTSTYDVYSRASGSYSIIANIKGATGDAGADGIDGTNGIDGDDGLGIVSIIKTGTVGLVDTYTITYTDSSTDTFDITNGADGAGSGDTMSPATNTDSYLPQWDGVNSKTLKNGVAIPAGGLAGITALGDKVDKVAGKGLSTEDYTSTEKTKLSGIATGATANNNIVKFGNYGWDGNHTCNSATPTVITDRYVDISVPAGKTLVIQATGGAYVWMSGAIRGQIEIYSKIGAGASGLAGYVSIVYGTVPQMAVNSVATTYTNSTGSAVTYRIGLEIGIIDAGTITHNSASFIYGVYQIT